MSLSSASTQPSRPPILEQAAALGAPMAAPALCILFLLPHEDFGARKCFWWQLGQELEVTGTGEEAFAADLLGGAFSCTDNHIPFSFRKIPPFLQLLTCLLAAGARAGWANPFSFHRSQDVGWSWQLHLQWWERAVFI